MSRPSLKTLPGVTISKWLEAKRRYANARRRARFWSGIPSFCPWKRSRETRTSKLWEKYELAMCDCKSWEAEVHRMTGKKVKHYDPKADFAVRFTQLMGKASNADLSVSAREKEKP